MTSEQINVWNVSIIWVHCAVGSLMWNAGLQITIWNCSYSMVVMWCEFLKLSTKKKKRKVAGRQSWVPSFIPALHFLNGHFGTLNALQLCYIALNQSRDNKIEKCIQLLWALNKHVGTANDYIQHLVFWWILMQCAKHE